MLQLSLKLGVRVSVGKSAAASVNWPEPEQLPSAASVVAQQPPPTTDSDVRRLEYNNDVHIQLTWRPTT